MNNENNSFVMPIKDLEDINYGYNDCEYLRELGATFSESHYENYNKHFVTVNLPEGFTIGESFISNNFKYRIIYDENNNKRGSIYIKCDNMNVANIVLAKKYRVFSKSGSCGEFKYSKIYFGNEDEILFEYDSISTNDRSRSPLYVQSRIATLIRECEEKADILYPDWRNPLAYWDEELEKTDSQTLIKAKKN